MRDLVSKAEKLLSASREAVLPVVSAPAVPAAPAAVPAAAPAAAPAAVVAAAEPPLPPLPTPELIGEQLPGGLPILEEVVPSL